MAAKPLSWGGNPERFIDSRWLTHCSFYSKLQRRKTSVSRIATKVPLATKWATPRWGTICTQFAGNF